MVCNSLIVALAPFFLFVFIGDVIGPITDTWASCNCRWLDWESWSSCTETCGGGSQVKRRKVRHWDTPECQGFEACASNDMGEDYRSCNTACYNGGTYRDYNTYRGGGYCSCRDGTRGLCCEQIVTCGQPASLKNGYMQGSDYTYNNQIRYYCNAKYNLTGTSVRTCNKYGYWTGTTPTCHFVASCESSPCQNQAPCTNLLDDYRCQCHPGWTGKNCETDIQPPVVVTCPDDIITHETELEVRKEWQIPIIEDPFGNHVDVTSNYPGNSSVFPWGDFTVQYSAVKPSNGLTTECTFNITTRPHPCDALPAPTHGIVVCNNWQTEYASVCMTLCKDGYVFATGTNLQWYNCGATGHWLPPPAPVQCVPDDVLSVTLDVDVPRLPNCTATIEQHTLGQFYVQKLKASQFNILCLDYRSNCDAENVVISWIANATDETAQHDPRQRATETDLDCISAPEVGRDNPTFKGPQMIKQINDPYNFVQSNITQAIIQD